MSFWNNLNALGKGVVLLLLTAIVLAVGTFFGLDDKIDALVADQQSAETITYTDLTWIGFMPGHVADFPMPVEVERIESPPDARAAWYSGGLDTIWGTVDTLPVEGDAFFANDPVVYFATDQSRGGDNLIGQPYITSIDDLCNGRTVAYAPYSPHHSLLLVALEAAGCTIDDVESVTVTTPEDAFNAYVAGQVDAAMVWAPFHIMAQDARDGTNVLFSTTSTPYLIPNVWIAERSYYEANIDKLTDFAEAWLRASAELNSNPGSRDAAYIAFADHVGLSEQDIAASFNDTRLMTLGDNVAAFGLNPGFRGLTFETIYDQMTDVYRRAGVLDSRVPSWNDISDTRVVETLRERMEGPEHAPGDTPEYQALSNEEQAVAVDAPELASRAAQINFAVGSSSLTPEAQFIIDRDFLPTAQRFETRIRVEGHTDATGSRANNLVLSERRAAAVVDYLVGQGIDRNRFVVSGRGPDQPLCGQSTETCYAQNRRTEFELLQ